MEESEILFDQQAEEQAKRLLAYYSCLRKQQKMSQSELGTDHRVIQNSDQSLRKWKANANNPFHE